MKAKIINDQPRTWVLILEKGEEAVSTIEGFAKEEAVGAAQITAIGAFSDAMLGFYDWEMKDYRKTPVTE